MPTSPPPSRIGQIKWSAKRSGDKDAKALVVNLQTRKGAIVGNKAIPPISHFLHLMLNTEDATSMNATDDFGTPFENNKLAFSFSRSTS